MSSLCKHITIFRALSKSFADKSSRKIYSKTKEKMPQQWGTTYLLMVKIRIKIPVFFEQICGINDPSNIGTRNPFLLPSCVAMLCTVHREKEENRSAGNTETASKTVSTVAECASDGQFRVSCWASEEDKTNRCRVINTLDVPHSSEEPIYCRPGCLGPVYIQIRENCVHVSYGGEF